MADPAHTRDGFWEQQQSLQKDRSAFECMNNNNMQLLQMRVDNLERQVAMLSAQVMAAALPPCFQAYPGVTYGMPPATSNVTQISAMPTPVPANMYFFQPPGMPAAVPANGATADDGHATKQLEDELQRRGAVAYGGASAGSTTNPEAAAAATMTLVPNNFMASPANGISGFPGVIADVSNPNGTGPGIPFMTAANEVALASSMMQGPPPSSTMMSNTLQKFVFSDPAMNGAVSDGMNANMNNVQRSCAVTLDPLQATNEKLEQACQHTKVRVLCLKGCKGITNLNPISRLQNLWLLNLQGCSLTVDDNAVRTIATYNTRLSRLNLCGCDRVTDARSLAQLPLMFDLNLSGTMIGNASLEAISNGCSQLSRLAINSCQQLTDVACLSNLSELKLLYCRYSENIDPTTITTVLTGIGENLLTLNVDGIRFRQLDLSNLPHTTALKNFNCKDNTQLRDLDWLLSVPHAAKAFESLEMLDVEGCESLASFGMYITSLKRLKTMRLTNTAITNEELSRISACPALSVIHLEDCAGITNVGCLANVPSLTKVTLSIRMQHENTNANGVAALRKAGVDIVFASASNHHGQGGAAHGMSTTPTSRFAPSIPTTSPITKFEPHAFP
ncbi:cysteine-leucine rich protein, putative [Leishmania tarentolae]|uniref:Cysteine-leucine rich protein, putative n=1 Tax=Leishmania tarentolae TaxID=5689 RepID=A0A640KSZ9_LEITA|nr:cysteine-leucine rich protein, putative [Leishmania tarentolae]